MEMLSKSEEETYKYAKKLAPKLKNGDILALSGDLGSGKTTFVKGLANALGIKSNITSPTFVLMKEYRLKNGQLTHVDCYRMNSYQDAEGIGLDEKFNNRDGIVVIEWAEKIKQILPKNTKWIMFKTVTGGKIIKE